MKVKFLSRVSHCVSFEPLLVVTSLIVHADFPSTPALERQLIGGEFWPRKRETLILDPPLLLIFIVTLGTSQTLSKFVIWTRLRLCSFNSSNSGQVCCWVCISKTRQQIYTSLPFAKDLCRPSTKPEMIGFLHHGPCR